MSASTEPEEQPVKESAAEVDLSQPSVPTSGGQTNPVSPAPAKSDAPDYVRQEIDYTVKTKPPFQGFAILVFLILICVALFAARMAPQPNATPSPSSPVSHP